MRRVAAFTMAISVIEILQAAPGGSLARFRHEEAEFVALLDGEASIDCVEEVTFEMGCEEIATAHVLEKYDDADSGIWQGPNETIILRGRVHNILGDGDDTLIDLYLQNGPEFFCFRAADAKLQSPTLNVGIELLVKGLTIYPNS